MCFYVDKKDLNPKIADKDIICYKVIKQIPDSAYYVKSSFNQYIYRIGQLNVLIKLVVIEIPELFSEKENDVFYVIEEGYHSYSNVMTAVDNYFPRQESLIECTIPVGTEYYYNEDRNEYVSSNIILNKLL